MAHRIYLDVAVGMVVVAPFVREPVVVRQPVILAEEIFPGRRARSAYVQLVGYSGRLEEWLALQSGAGRGRRPAGARDLAPPGSAMAHLAVS